MADKVDKVFDPFPSDPAILAMGKSDKQSFNPEVSPFTPMSELGTWRVIAAEYTGKAVAVMQTGDAKLLVCTSPSFNSKCRHPGVPCLDWDNVKLAPAQGSQPDSGVDNTDAVDTAAVMDTDKIARVAQWSADAARHSHAGDWDTEDPQVASDWVGPGAETSTFHPAAEWTDVTAQSPVWCTPQGETHLVQWSPVAMEPGAAAGAAQQSPNSAYNNSLHITVEYHNPQPEPFSPQEAAYSPGYPGEDPLVRQGGFGNDPLVVFHDSSHDTSDSWAMGMGMDFTRLSLNNSVSLDNCSQVDRYEQELKREEFKNKILLNCGLIQEQSDEDKIRQDFKKQILSNLDKKGPTTNKPSSAAKSNDEKIRDDFKNQILSNLSS